MGEFFNEKFVSAHQQAGDFDAVVRDGKVVQKNGGNVASYFCTPEGRVVSAVLGPVGAETLLEEAEWAVAAYALGKSLRPNEREAKLAEQHAVAARERRGRQAQLHNLLARRPRLGLDEVYRQVLVSLGEGQRARRLDSAELVGLEEDNQRLAEEARRIRERLPDGGGSLKLRREQAENDRLQDDVEQLRARERKLAKNEADAFNWLRSAIPYLKEDKEAAKARLRIVVTRYPNTKAAIKAAQLLADLNRTGTESSR